MGACQCGAARRPWRMPPGDVPYRPLRGPIGTDSSRDGGTVDDRAAGRRGLARRPGPRPVPTLADDVGPSDRSATGYPGLLRQLRSRLPPGRRPAVPGRRRPGGRRRLPPVRRRRAPSFGGARSRSLRGSGRDGTGPPRIPIAAPRPHRPGRRSGPDCWTRRRRSAPGPAGPTGCASGATPSAGTGSSGAGRQTRAENPTTDHTNGTDGDRRSGGTPSRSV
jgi:hypothetical protein